jgi:uncharacterized protein YlzI (FlbEa/FlbD family)
VAGVSLKHKRTNTVRAIIVDGRAAPLMEKNANSMGIKVIATTRHPHLYQAIAFHPDTVICPVGGNKMVVEPTVFEYYKRALSTYKVELLKGTTELSSNYPRNIAYNIATVGKKAFLRVKYADDTVLKELKKGNFKPINVKQGYAKCSTAVVGNNGIITSDPGIYTGAVESGIDVLMIRPGHIKLEGFDYGFIGGCCGMLSQNILAFAGNPYIHPDADAIMEHAKKHGVKTISLCDGTLRDIGSIISVVENN